MFYPKLDAILLEFLAEDLGSGDISSSALEGLGERRGWLTARKPGVIAGLPFARRIFELAGATTWTSLVTDGDEVEAGKVLAYVDGPGHLLLQGERTALNLLQRLSGIATKTRRMVRIAAAHGHARIGDTRKTSPGLRWFEKYAVRIGGGCNHRWGLYDAVLLKDNHIKLAGGIDRAVAAVRETIGLAHKIEVEAESLEQVRQALAAGADIIMLDNMSPEQVAEAVKIVAGQAVTEASGGIDEQNLARYASTGVDYISMGALTHSVSALDIAFDLDEPKQKVGQR